MERIICLLIGYVFGMFQTAFIYGKLHHIDIREHGSGNAGTTNALRTLGFKAGLIVFLGDIIKPVLAALLVRLIFKETHPDDITLLVIYSGIGVVLGHNFPAYLKFKGGKGIAATAGVVLSLGCWQLIVLGLFVFFLILFITKYVSSGSLTMVSAVFGGFVVFVHMGIIGGLGSTAIIYEATAVWFVFVLLAFIRHKDNIVRLWNGTENELGLLTKKKKQEV